MDKNTKATLVSEYLEMIDKAYNLIAEFNFELALAKEFGKRLEIKGKIKKSRNEIENLKKQINTITIM